MLMFSGVSMLLLYLIERVAAVAAVESAEVRRQSLRTWLSILPHLSPPTPTGRTMGVRPP